MRFHWKHNQTVGRLKAGFIATLYVALSTLGALTHNHAIAGADNDTDQASICRIDGTQAAPHFDREASSTSHHCAYCDWQTSSVSPALLPMRWIAPTAVRTEYVTPSVNGATVSLPRASSRAPPTA